MTRSEMESFAVVMGVEAFRICMGQKTKKQKPSEVIRWMRAMLAVREEP